jgi:putative SOS response-associated peptidase YedK
MCGRFVVTRSSGDLLDGLMGGLPELEENFNVAPSDDVAVVRQRPERGRELENVRWGFVSSWYPDLKKRPQPINARIETVATSGMFRNALLKQRCIIPAAGYYEWTILPDGSKQPNYIYAPDQALAMAGLLSAWPDRSKPDGDPDKWTISMAIITRDAHVAPGEVHDRMPAFLTAGGYEAWLDSGLESGDLLQLLDRESFEVAHELKHYEVSKEANSVRNNGPSLIEPLRSS